MTDPTVVAVSEARSRDARDVRGFLDLLMAEGLIVPVGIALAAFLSRTLPLELYGQYVLVVAVVVWLETGIASMFGRAAWQLVAGTAEWRAPAATIVWLHGVVGVFTGALLFLGAPLVASWFGSPSLAQALRVLALDIPIAALAIAHRQIAVGLGEYRVRALSTAGRSAVRLALVLLLVQLGFSLIGALVAQVCASVVELAICRTRVRPGWRRDAAHAPSRVLVLAGPLFISAMSVRLVERLDLVLLQVLRRSTEDSAVFGAAQQLASLPLIASAAVVPVLSSALASLARNGRTDETADRLRTVTRLTLLLLPLSAVASGSGSEIARLIYGTPFVSAGPLLLPLLVSAFGMVMLSIASAGLIVAERSRTTVPITLGMVVLALIGHVFAIPRWGMAGAAWVTAGVSVLGALVATYQSSRSWRAQASPGVFAATTVVSAAAYFCSRWFVTQGAVLIAEIVALTAAAGVGLYASGAVTRRDLAMLTSALGVSRRGQSDA